MRSVGVLLFALLAACGATGDPSDPPPYAPVSGAGPFKRLEERGVLEAPGADLDDPTVVADGARLALWVTVRRAGLARIEHADADDLAGRFGPLQPALAASAGWEGQEVSAPSVVWGSPALMFYLGRDGIGVATAEDAEGHAWRKAGAPLLTGDVGPPGAVRIGDRVRVYWPSRGALWAAEAPVAEVASPGAWRPLDGDPATPERDPMVARAPFAVALERVQPRADATPAGRTRHDLYFTARQDGMVEATIGFASSFGGERFSVAAQPILTPPAARSPTVTPYGAGYLLLFVEKSGARDVVSAATSP